MTVTANVFLTLAMAGQNIYTYEPTFPHNYGNWHRDNGRHVGTLVDLWVAGPVGEVEYWVPKPAEHSTQPPFHVWFRF